MGGMNTQADLLSTSQAAEILGVVDSAVRAMIARGVFPGAVKIGASWILPRKAVEDERDKGQTTGYPRGRPRGGRTHS